MGKIGFLGGTFNPIHNGHIKLAESAYKQLGLDKVLIVPTGISYLKASDGVLSKDIRSDMVKLAIENYKYFEFCDIEINKEGNTYTYQTLEDLKVIYPNDKIYFIIGADTLYSIESWKYPDKVMANSIIAVMIRNDGCMDDIISQCDYLREKFKASIEVLNAPKVDISSTQIRTLIHENSYDKSMDMLPEKVYSYILDKKLYM